MALNLIKTILLQNSNEITQLVYKIRYNPISGNFDQFVGKYIVIMENCSDTKTKSISLDSPLQGDAVKSYHVILWHPTPREGNGGGGYFTFHSKCEHLSEPTKLEGLRNYWTKIRVFGENGFDKESYWMKCVPGSKYSFGDGTMLNFSDSDIILNHEISSGDTCNNCLALKIEFSGVEPQEDFKFMLDQNLEPGLTLAKLYDDKDFADVEIQVLIRDEEGAEVGLRKFSAHKAVLGVKSCVLKAMFLTPMTENTKSIVKIDDYQPDTIEEFLKYLYLGRANLEDFGVDLLKLADKYDTPELMKLCQTYIAANIPKFGWSKVFDLLEMYHDNYGEKEQRMDILKKGVTTYYKINEDSLRKCPDFEAAIQLNPIQFIELFKSA